MGYTMNARLHQVSVRTMYVDGFWRASAMTSTSERKGRKRWRTSTCESRDEDRAISYALTELALKYERGEIK